MRLSSCGSRSCAPIRFYEAEKIREQLEMAASSFVNSSEVIILPEKNRRFMMETYYKPEDLPKFPDIGQQAPELAQKFFDYYNAVFAEGALTEREKSLIALAVAHAVQCPYCIDAFTQASLEKGSNLEEMTEAVHVVTAIRGGASLVHGVQMRNIAQKISM
jgi:alkylhydroperoxidase/carboxymuconolactone decarboxylase family protein